MVLGTPTLLTSFADDTDSNTYVTPAVNPTPGGVIYVSLMGMLSAVDMLPTVRDSAGTDFVRVGYTKQTSGVDTHSMLFWLPADSFVPGSTITIIWPQVMSSCQGHIYEQAGVDVTAPFVQVASGPAYIGTGTVAGASFPNPFSDPTNTTLALFATRQGTGGSAIAPDSPLSELLETFTTLTPGALCTAYNEGEDATPSATLSSSLDWGVILAEVQAAGAPQGSGGRPVANNVKIPLYVPRLASVSPPPPPAPSEWRDLLMLRRVGYAAVANVTGGYAGPEVTVTNDDDSGAGSLRSFAGGGNFIVFDPANQPYNIDLLSILALGPNTTLSCTDAGGNPVEVNMDHRQLTMGENCIVHNLWKGMDCTNNATDIIRVPSAVTKFWFNECTFGDPTFSPGTHTYDEYFDATQTSSSGKMGTLSGILWAPGAGGNFNELVLLLGNNQSDENNDRLYLTMFNNYFNGVRQRMPLMGSSRLHSFNNVRKWQLAGIHARSDAGVGGGRILSESDIFDASMAPSNLDDGLVLEGGSAADIRDRRLVGGAIGVNSLNPGLVNVFQGWAGQDFSYTYEVDESGTATLYANIVAAAGRKLP